MVVRRVCKRLELLTGEACLAIEIVEIISRSEQGVTRPYICRADDNKIYYVKSYELPVRERVAELICNRLAVSLGLPVANSVVVDVPSSILSNVSNSLDVSGLESGPAFASERQTGGGDIFYSHVESVPFDLRCKVLMFDRWIRNSDSTLSKHGGNPNMLWVPNKKAIVLIDHNLAFDTSFDTSVFYETHVFAGEGEALQSCEDEITASEALRDEYKMSFELALGGWDTIVREIPLEWLNGNTPVETDELLEQLDEYKLNCFWKISEEG